MRTKWSGGVFGTEAATQSDDTTWMSTVRGIQVRGTVGFELSFVWVHTQKSQTVTKFL